MGSIRARAGVCLSGVCLLAGIAHAQVADTISQFPEANRVLARINGVGPSFAPATGSAASGTLKVGKNFTMPAPGGRSLAVNATINVSKGAAATMAARALAAAAGPVVGGAAILGTMYLDYRIRQAEGGGLERDSGVVPGVSEVWEYQLAGGYPCCFASPGAAVADAMSSANALGNGYSYTSLFVNSPVVSGSSATGGWGYRVCLVSQPTNCTDYTDRAYSGSSMATQECSGGSVGFDGKCASGSYAPVTPVEAAALPIAYPPSLSDAEYQALVNEALGKLTMPVADIPAGDFVLNVLEPFVQGAVTTTVEPDGTVTEVATLWNIGRIADNFSHEETVEYTKKTKTTTTAPGQSPVVTETTETGSTPGDAADAKCDGLEGTLGCTQVGEAPSDVVPTTSHTIDFEEESIALPSSCPVAIQALPWLSVPYTAACTFAESIRALVIAAGALSAGLMCVLALRGS